MKHKLLFMDLRLFDGEGVGTGGEGIGADGSAPETTQEGQVNSGEENAQVQVADAQNGQGQQKTSFEELIKGEYKQDFQDRVQDIIDKRFKESKIAQSELQCKLDKMDPAIQILYSKYGVSDIDALVKAIQNDDSLFEEEAMQKGMTPQQLREQKNLEIENRRLRAQQDAYTQQFNTMEQERLQREHFNNVILPQAEQCRSLYPDFDLTTELGNETFSRMLNAGFDVTTAYKAAHVDEITTNMMATAAQQAQQQTVNNIVARNSKLPSNGVNGGNPAVNVAKNYEAMSDKEFLQCLERARRGEPI